ncbi:hypothetical protein TMatcc_006920 [Talaromyces marneffei ATCC 18224]
MKVDDDNPLAYSNSEERTHNFATMSALARQMHNITGLRKGHNRRLMMQRNYTWSYSQTPE